METHLTQEDSKLQGIHEHHPSNSKHVKYSVQLKERIESNITSRNMHCITQISRLLFALKAPLKKKTSNRLGKPLERTTKLETHAGQDQKDFSRL